MPIAIEILEFDYKFQRDEAQFHSISAGFELEFIFFFVPFSLSRESLNSSKDAKSH